MAVHMLDPVFLAGKVGGDLRRLRSFLDHEQIISFWWGLGLDWWIPDGSWGFSQCQGCSLLWSLQMGMFRLWVGSIPNSLWLVTELKMAPQFSGELWAMRWIFWTMWVENPCHQTKHGWENQYCELKINNSATQLCMTETNVEETPYCLFRFSTKMVWKVEHISFHNPRRTHNLTKNTRERPATAPWRNIPQEWMKGDSCYPLPK